MVILKNKIKLINSLPEDENNKTSIINILIIIISIIIFVIFATFIIIKNVIPYLTATDIKNIIGKKVNITDCNTKDYIIINEDKSYTMSITNNKCEQSHYEGNIIIKKNEVIFNKNIKGIIDKKKNIIINNKVFESEKNE